MKTTLPPEQLADILERALVAAGESVQGIEFTDAEIEFDMNVDMDFSALPVKPARPSTSSASASAAAPCSGTRKISIRLPNALTQAFKAEAKRRCIPYQTLIKRVLKETSKGW